MAIIGKRVEVVCKVGIEILAPGFYASCHRYHRIFGEPQLLHRLDLARSLPASASTRSLRRQGIGPNSQNQTYPVLGEDDRDCASWFLHGQTSSRQNADIHGGSRLVPKPYMTTTTTRFCPLPLHSVHRTTNHCIVQTRLRHNSFR